MATMTFTQELKGLNPSTAHSVRVVSMSDCKAAAASLSESFADDEVARYPIYTADMASYPDEYKYAMHQEIMEYLTAAHIYNGLVTTVGPNYAGVAIWLPPGTEIDGWLTILRSGLWRLYYKLSHEGRRRFFAEFLPLLHHTKQGVLGARDADSYYLVYLGTRPGEQRKGYGSALIKQMTDKADAENRACYLESSASKNNRLYRAHGFTRRKTIYLNYGARPVAMDIMVREPVVVAAARSTPPMMEPKRSTVAVRVVEMDIHAEGAVLDQAPPAA